MLNILYFSSPTCGPCKTMGPIVEAVSSENANVSISKIDTSKDRASILTHNVNAVPTLVFLKGGNEVDRVVGLISKAQLITKINSFK